MMASKESEQIAAILDSAHRAASAPSGGASLALQPWTPELIRHLVLAVLIFTMLALALTTILMWRQKAPGDMVLKVFGVISIIGISAVLLVAGFSNEQLTPIVGLFGAIAGYLLGKEPAAGKPGQTTEGGTGGSSQHG